ncbi:MAG: hypothetical protein ACKVTZ_18320, partial [Bacteroidia bacterium]
IGRKKQGKNCKIGIVCVILFTKGNNTMNEDEKLLVFVFIGLWISIILLIANTERQKRIATAGIHLLIHLAYSTYFLHGLYFKGAGGTSLGWLVFLLFTLCLHLVINLGILAYKAIKKSSWL